MTESALEAELAFHMRALNLPEPVRELRFMPRCCKHVEAVHDDDRCRGCVVQCEEDGRAGRSARCYCAHMFDRGRLWRFDFAWPDRMIAVEVDGGTWTGGRHVRPAGYQKDAEKLNAAALKGWTVLRYDRIQVKSGVALNEIEKALRLPSPSTDSEQQEAQA